MRNTHNYLLIVVKDAPIPSRSVFSVAMIDNILPFPPLTIHSSLWQHLSKKSSTWIGCENCYQLLQTNHNRSCKICHNYQFTEYNILFMCYHQNNSCSNSNETFMLSQWTSMWVMFDLLTGFTGQPFLVYLPANSVWDMNKESILYK